MVKLLPLLALSACATGAAADRATMPMKRSPIPLELVGECTALVPPVPRRSPSWESLVLVTDVETWNQHACAPLEQALTPLEQTDLARKTLREECDAKATILPEKVRPACRAACAAKRWVDARDLGRRRTREAMGWFKDHVDEVFDRLLSCPAMPKRFGGQLDDRFTRVFFECAGVRGLPAELEFTMQFVNERVSWRDKGGETWSARAVEVGSLLVKAKDENLPWRAVVARCNRSGRLVVVSGDF